MSLNPTDAESFRARLAELRDTKGLTQPQLSEAIGKALPYIGRVERGEIDTPPLDTMAEIAKHLDVPFSELFFSSGHGDSAEQLRARIQRLIETNDVSILRRFYRVLLVMTEK